MKQLAAKEWNKVFYKSEQKYRIQVRAELVHRDGNSNAYFSITGEVERQAKNNRWMPLLSGCIHEEILEQLPELKPLVLVHLANENGVPMHAYQNAAYWAGQTKYQQFDIPNLARLLRVDCQEALEMFEYVEMYWGELDAVTTPAMAWQDACENFGYPIRWKKQADQARKMLNQIEQLEETK